MMTGVLPDDRLAVTRLSTPRSIPMMFPPVRGISGDESEALLAGHITEPEDIVWYRLKEEPKITNRR